MEVFITQVNFMQLVFVVCSFCHFCRHRSGSRLVRVMACHPMAPCHYSIYLNQSWFLISAVLWHSPESNFTAASAQATILHNEFENYTFKITATSPRNQWASALWPSDAIEIWSTLALIMAWCLMASNQHLTQCWLSHWGRVTHICVGNLTRIGSDNDLSLVGAKPLPEPMLEYC